LINCYKVIKEDVEELIKLLKEYKKKHNKEVYYEVRAEDPKLLSDTSRAGRFIYLNKTCFNGLYRVNSKGQFNVPMGSYKNPSIVMEKELREISKLLKDVEIKIMNFEEITKLTKKGDFIYFDPPYYPLKKGKSFTTYTAGNFLEKEQEQLKKVFSKLDKKGCKVMLSNSDTKFIKDLYKEFIINFVNANRIINCDGSKRGKIKEVVITSFINRVKCKRCNKLIALNPEEEKYNDGVYSYPDGVYSNKGILCKKCNKKEILDALN